MWYLARTRLHAAYKLRVLRDHPRAEWIIYVDGEKGTILSKYDNLAQARGHATVFDPNPVLAAPDWVPVTENGVVRRPPAEAYRRVTLGDLDGRGYFDGRRVTTKRTARRVRRKDLDWSCASTQPGFDEAMVYFHVDRAIRYLESLGYRGRRRRSSARRSRSTRTARARTTPGTARANGA